MFCKKFFLHIDDCMKKKLNRVPFIQTHKKKKYNYKSINIAFNEAFFHAFN